MNLFFGPFDQNLQNYVYLQFAIKNFAFCEITGQHTAVVCQIHSQHATGQAGICVNQIEQAVILSSSFGPKLRYHYIFSYSGSSSECRITIKNHDADGIRISCCIFLLKEPQGATLIIAAPERNHLSVTQKLFLENLALNGSDEIEIQ